MKRLLYYVNEFCTFLIRAFLVLVAVLIVYAICYKYIGGQVMFYEDYYNKKVNEKTIRQ